MAETIAIIRCSGIEYADHPNVPNTTDPKIPPMTSKGIVGFARDVRNAGISAIDAYATVATGIPAQNAQSGRGCARYPAKAAAAPAPSASSSCVPGLLGVTSPCFKTFKANARDAYDVARPTPAVIPTCRRLSMILILLGMKNFEMFPKESSQNTQSHLNFLFYRNT